MNTNTNSVRNSTDEWKRTVGSQHVLQDNVKMYINISTKNHKLPESWGMRHTSYLFLLPKNTNIKKIAMKIIKQIIKLKKNISWSIKIQSYN